MTAIIKPPRPYFVDVDGTLTSDGGRAGAEPISERIDAVRRMAKAGVEIVIWSARGTEYARDFADTHGLYDIIAIGKPEACVDDNPTIRPGGLKRRCPVEFFRELVV